MSKLNIIKKLTYLENVMCVYRNYSSQSVGQKRLVKLRIFIEIITYLFVYYRFLKTSLRILSKYNNIHFYFLFSYNLISITNTLSVITLSVFKAKYFEEFVASIDAVYTLNKDDAQYQDSMKKLNKRFLCVSSLSLIIATALISIYGTLIVENATELTMIDLFFDLIFQLRYFFTSVAFYVLLEVVVASMHYLNCSMTEALKKLNSEIEGEFVESGGVLSEICFKLKMLKQTSRDLACAGAGLRKCFEIQLVISLATDTLYYIILMCQTTTLYIEKVPHYKIGGQSFLFLFLVFLLIRVLIVSAGQRARNETDRLNATLASFNYLLVDIPGSCACKLRRMTTDLSRELRVRPLHIRLLSSLHIQMPLLTQILSIVLTYTIILLQFNHVI